MLELGKQIPGNDREKAKWNGGAVIDPSRPQSSRKDGAPESWRESGDARSGYMRGARLTMVFSGVRSRRVGVVGEAVMGIGRALGGRGFGCGCTCVESCP